MKHTSTRLRQILGTPKILLSAALLQAAVCSVGSAALVVYDGFDYGASSGDLTGKNGGSGWTGAYTDGGNSTVYTSTGLTYTGLTTTAGAVNTADGGTATTTSFRVFGSAITTGETWISFLGRRDVSNTSNFAGVSFYSGGTATANSEFTFASGGATTWRILDNNNGGASVSTSTGVSTTINVTDLVVAQILWNGAGEETVNLWINPTIGVAPGTPNATDTINVASGIDRVRYAGQSGVGHTYDELRIGDSFASVTPVPEVSTTTALLLGLSSLAFLRRRLS